MTNFALVTCKEKNNNTSDLNIIKRIGRKLFSVVYRSEYEKLVKRIDLYENVSSYIIELPYDEKSLVHINKKKLQSLLEKVLRQNNIEECIIPNNISRDISLEGCISISKYNKLLFKYLTRNMIEKICCDMGLELVSLNVCIVYGGSNKELYSFINMISPLVKYVTVLIQNKAIILDEIDRIYIDSGLAVMATNNYKNALGNTNIIINLGSFNKFNIRSIVNKKLIVFDFGEMDVSKLPDDAIVIKEVDIGLPKVVFSKIDQNVYRFYKESEIAKVILYNNFEDEILCKRNIAEGELMDIINKKFKEDGYVIRNFLGVHGLVDA